MVFERSGVSDRLGVDQLAEGVGLARDLAVVGVFGHQLQEPADRGAALVQLSGRVQEARPVADGRGAAGPVAEQRFGRGSGRRRGLGLVDVGLDGA